MVMTNDAVLGAQVLYVDQIFDEEEAPPRYQVGDGSGSAIRDFALKKLDTPYGKIVAYSSITTHWYNGNRTTGDECTIVPGIYLRDMSPTADGIKRMSVRTIQSDEREPVERILREHGYKGHMVFW